MSSQSLGRGQPNLLHPPARKTLSGRGKSALSQIRNSSNNVPDNLAKIEEDLNETEWSAASAASISMSAAAESQSRASSSMRDEINLPALVELWMQNTKELFSRSPKTYWYLGQRKDQYIRSLSDILADRHIMEL